MSNHLRHVMGRCVLSASALECLYLITCYGQLTVPQLAKFLNQDVENIRKRLQLFFPHPDMATGLIQQPIYPILTRRRGPKEDGFGWLYMLSPLGRELMGAWTGGRQS